MSAPVLARIRRSTARAIEDAFAEMWGAALLDELAAEAEETLAEYLDYPAKAEARYYAAYRALIPAIQRNEPIDWVARGTPVREFVDSSLEVLLALRKWVRRIEGTGRRVGNAAQLDRTVAEMERVRAQVLERWPWPMTAEEWAEVEAEIEREGGQTLDEAFAEIAGMSKDAWLAKVEARRRELRGEDEAAQVKYGTDEETLWVVRGVHERIPL